MPKPDPPRENRIVNVRGMDYAQVMGIVYVGRPMPGLFRGSDFGNPFSHRSSGRGVIRVATAAEAVDSYRRWLAGEPVPT